MLNLGYDFDHALLTAAGVNPDTAQSGTISVEFLPETGPVTVRYTGITTVDAATVRVLVSQAASGTLTTLAAAVEETP